MAVGSDGQPLRGEDGNITIVGAEDFLTTSQSGQGFAPPAFSGTAAGIELQGAQQRLAQAEADVAALERARLQARTDIERQKLADRAALARQKVSDAAAKVRQLISSVTSGLTAQIGEEGAFRRSLLGEVGAGARSQLEAGEAFRRNLLGEVGAGARSQLEGEEAFRRSLLGETGAGVRSELEQATARRGQSISAVLDTFRNLGELSTRPSDFVRLAFNAQGIQPPGETPTDTVRGRQQEFFQNQLGTANADPRSFADLFTSAREGIGGFGEAGNFADIFSQAREGIGGFGPAPDFTSLFRDAQRRIGGFQFGGHPQEEPGVIEMRRGRDGSFERAAIVGENKRPELVFGATEVIPNLSPSELRLLRAGGVGGAQFGLEGQGSANVFDFPSLREGAGTSPLFSGGFRTAAAGGVGAVTGAPALNPLDFTARRFKSLLPFQRELAFGRFGESIVDPNDPNKFLRAGIDPETALEIIRRQSLFGRAPAVTRFG